MKDNLRSLYRHRFEGVIESRRSIWSVLCDNFFQKYVPEDAVVLDIGAGYCEFINNIRAGKKFALDLNPDTKEFAEEGVEIIFSDPTDLSRLKDDSVDVVFASNVFEHLIKDDILKTLYEVHRVLKMDGSFLIMQPNFRFCYKDYWMFFDHITPIDDRSLSEVLESNEFKIEKIIIRFLPYTTKQNLPSSTFLLRIYLLFPPLWQIFGKQTFIQAKKT